jgi:hypothetical protein
MKLFGTLPSIRKTKQFPTLGSVTKPTLAQSIDPEKLSYMYRIAPGPSSKEVVDIVNLLFRLQAGDYPAITLPEAIFYYLCEKYQVEFIYQADFLGGRNDIGGAVIDFLLPEYGVVIYINGVWWHSKPDVIERDLAATIAVVGEVIGGVKVSSAVRVSDLKLQSLERDDVFKLAVAGIEDYGL